MTTALNRCLRELDVILLPCALNQAADTAILDTTAQNSQLVSCNLNCCCTKKSIYATRFLFVTKRTLLNHYLFQLIIIHDF